MNEDKLQRVRKRALDTVVAGYVTLPFEDVCYLLGLAEQLEAALADNKRLEEELMLRQSDIAGLWAVLHLQKEKLEAAEAERDRLLRAESDALFDLINAVKKEILSRDWILEGRGPYEWDDEDYKREAGWAFQAMQEILDKAVKDGRQRFDEALAQKG